MNNDDPFAAVLDQPVSIDVGDDPFAAVVNQKSTIADDPFREVVRPKDTKEKLKAEQAKIAAEGDTGFAGGFGAEIGERLGEFGKGVAGIVPAAMKAVAALQHSMDQGYEEGDIPPEARPTFKAATAVEKFEEKILPSPTNPDIWHGVAQGGGQVAQMLAGGAAAKAAGAGMAGMTALASTMGGIQEFGDAYEMSRNRGDDPDTALAKSLGYATVAGLIENKLGAGRILRKYFPSPAEAVKKLTALGVSKTLLGNFVAGGLEEGSQRFAENWIVDGKPSMEGVMDEAGPGAIVEGIAGIPHVATTLRENGAPLTAAAVEQINLPILTAEQTGEIAPQLVAVSKADAAADNFAAAGTEQGILEAVEPDIGFDIRKMVKSNRAVELLTEAESTAGLNEILPVDETTDIRRRPIEIQPQKTEGSFFEKNFPDRNLTISLDWKKSYDKAQDIETKIDWLRSVANHKSTSPELADVLSKAEKLLEQQKHGRIASTFWDVSQNPAASSETKARAKKLYDEFYTPENPIELTGGSEKVQGQSVSQLESRVESEIGKEGARGSLRADWAEINADIESGMTREAALQKYVDELDASRARSDAEELARNKSYLETDEAKSAAMTPEEYKEKVARPIYDKLVSEFKPKKKGQQPNDFENWFKIGDNQENIIANAVIRDAPINAKAAERFGIEDQLVEQGYVRDGDLYVKKSKKGGDQIETQKEKGRQEVLTPTTGETKAGQKFQLQGQGPNLFTLIEKLPQTEVEKTNGEQPVRVKNERTGKEEIVLESELRQVKESTGEKPKRTTKADLNAALKKAGLDPSAFPDQKSKKSALERAAAKVEEAQKKLRGSRATVSMGVPKAILDLALESIRLALRAGATVQAAIEKGIAAALEKFSETNEDDLRAAIVESIASERKESQGFLTGQYASNPELRQAQEAEAFAQGKTDDQILSEVQGFSGGQSIPGLSDMNVPLVVANLTTSLFDKLTKTTDPVEVADLNAKIAKAASLLQQRDSVAGQGLQAVKLAKARMGFMAPYLAFRGLAQKMWARALGVPETVDMEGETVKVVKDSGKKAAEDVSEADVEKQIKSESVAKALLKAIRESGIKLSTLFLDKDHASQAERRKHLFDQIRKQFPDLTQEQKLALEKALSEAWENARLKIWRGQFKKIVGLPEVATDNILDAVQPELIRQANLGTLTDQAFRSAIARKLGLPDIDGNTAKEIIKLSQEAQAAPEGLLRNKILQKMIDKIQSSGDFSSWDLLRDYWYASTLSGLRTATAVLLGSWLTGAAMTTGMAFDLAITKASPAVASKLIAAYVMDTIEGFANGYDVFKTGDYTRRAEFADNINAVLSGKGKLDSLEGFLRHGNAKWKKALGVQAYVRRVIVGLDYVGAIATRGSGIIYNAALKGGDQLEIANRRFNKKLSQQAKTQAKVELGPGSKWVDVKARQLEILEEGLSHEIQQQAKVLGELAALNAQPVGWSGIAYGALEGLAQVIGKKAGVSRESASFGAFAFRTTVGLAFFRAALNQVGNASNWVPGIGGVQWFRSYLGTKTPEWSKNNPLRHLAILDENGQPITEDRRRLILAAQAMSISASIALYALAHAAADDDDKDGFDVSGSWRGYTPQEKKRKQEAGEIPYGFTLHKKTGRWFSWKDMGFGGAFVIPGELRDKERRTGKPTEFDDASKAFSTMTDAAAMGSLYVKDLSMLSGLFQALGVSAFNTEEAATGANRMAAQLTRPVSGMIPFSSLLREIDTWGDNQVYRPSSGADYWIMAIPFVRRYVGEGPEYNMAGLPVRKTLTPASRFVAEEANDPLVKALASLVNRGIMPHFPYNAGWIKDGERKSSKDFAERDYQYKVQAVKAWREIMLPDAAEISKMTDKEYQEYYQKNLAPIAQEIHDDFQNEIDPDVLRRRRGAKHGQRKYEKNPRYEMKGKE